MTISISKKTGCPAYYLAMVTLVFSLLIFSGCASKSQQAGDPAVNEADSANELAELPTVDLSAEILYGLLTSELSYFRDDVSTSLEILEKLAFETSDPRIAELVSVRAIGQRQFDVAANTTDLWVKLAPSSVEAWFANGISMGATQKLDQAVVAFQKAIELSPESQQQETIQNTSRTLSNSLDPAVAYSIFEKIVSPSPDSETARIQLIVLAVNGGEEEEIIDQMIADGFEANPGSDALASIKFSFEIQRERNSEAQDFAEAFLKRLPNSTGLRRSYAQYLADEGFYREAIDQYERIDDADSLYIQGTLHEQANYLDLSRDRFMDYFKRQPNNQRVLISLAELALKQKDHEEASYWIGQITDQRLSFSRHLLISKYIADTNSVDEGIALLEEYQTDNQQERLRVILVTEAIYREAGQIEQALLVLDSGLQEFPDNTTLLIAKSYTASELNLIEQVEAAVDAVLAQQPDNALAYNALGYTLIDQTDRLEEGVQYIEKALELKPNDPYILDSMGWAHFKLGNYDSAIELLELSISRRDDPVMAAHLGEVYWTIGQTSKARKIWKQAQSKSPDSDILAETILRLTGQ